MSTIPVATPQTSPGKREAGQCKRKPPPASTLLDFTDPRYPPFDLEDPFASLTELRRRSRSLSTDHASLPTMLLHRDASPFDLPLLSPKILPVGSGRRYTLTVALPASADTNDLPYSFGASPGATPDVKDLDTIGYHEGAKPTDRMGALEKLTQHSKSGELSGGCSLRDGSITNGWASHQHHHHRDHHHRRYTHISSFFRDASSNNDLQPTKSHYLPRKVSSLSYMYTPPLTPDLSGSLSDNSSSSLLDQTQPPVPMPSRPTSPAASFAKKLLPKRSVGSINLARSLRHKQSSNIDAKDLPSLPPLPATPTQTALPVADDAPSIPFPRASVLAGISDISLPHLASSPESAGAITSPQAFRSTSLTDREDQGYVTAPELPHNAPPGADLDAGLLPMGKNRLFSFSSRTLLRSRVNLFEINSNKKETSQASLRPASNPLNEHALPTPEQLRIAASLLVVSESGVRVRFGDLWEHHQTVVIFIRHFRFSGCQDYVRSITSDVDIEALEKAGLKIVIVGLGSPSLIAPYRQITGASFPIYTDPSLAVYRALGMSLKPTGAGPESTHQYVVSGNTIKTLGGLRRTLAARFVLPLFERGGDAAQLGGEFVLGPGREKGKAGKGGCVFAHRMQHAHAHTPILDVIAASGVQSLSARRMGRMQVQVQLQLQQGQGRGKRCESMEDEDAWMARRRRSLVRLRLKRQKRRDGGAQQVAAAEADELDMEKSVPRFPVVEEDEDEDEDDAEPRRYELRVEVC